LRLHFLGANRQVTGSRYLLEVGDTRIMIDCGLFQERAFVDRNWEPCPVPPEQIDFLLLTHAHLDHVGLVPRLVMQGFNNPIITVEPTVELAEIIMMDSGRIQEEDAKYKKRRHKKENRKGRHPEVPLYTAEDAKKVLPLLKGVGFNKVVELGPNVTVTFHEAGHILGSAIVELVVTEGDKTRRILFSGDIGQWDKPLVGDPTLLDEADYIIVESTYGNRTHKNSGSIEEQLTEIIKKTSKRGGNVVIPTFAVERAQELMYHISKLVHEDLIPDLPIFLDSPMAIDVTEVFRKFREYLDDETRALIDSDAPPLRFPGLRFTRTTEASKAIKDQRGPSIILASSGMCTGGRIKHHLRANITRTESTIVFVGYQAFGTLGRHVLEGNPEVRIHGRNWPVRAHIAKINGLSAHGDKDDLLRWLGNLDRKPKKVFLTHGDEKVSLEFADTINESLGWDTMVPHYQDVVELE
jgi:metallo-beta-lactamase family protein